MFRVLGLIAAFVVGAGCAVVVMTVAILGAAGKGGRP